jgi:hypothetical protein
MRPPATAAVTREYLNLGALAETYFRAAPLGGCYDPLARFHGGQAGNGWRGLHQRLDDFWPSRARDHCCGLGAWDLAQEEIPAVYLLNSAIPAGAVL